MCGFLKFNVNLHIHILHTRLFVLYSLREHVLAVSLIVVLWLAAIPRAYSPRSSGRRHHAVPHCSQ